MAEKQRTPIEQLTDALAKMTERAMVAEKAKEAAEARALDWYKKWEQADKDYKELQGILNAEIQEHQKTKGELEEAVHAVDVLNDELVRMRKQAQA